MSVLKGIRVLDFGRYVAGPYCATLLGYLGAQVIRIERIGGGEDRFIAPVTAAGEGAVLLQTACNKRSLALDFRKPKSAEIVRRLVAESDVVVANLPPATLASLGLDYATLCRVRPQIILATQSAFGDAGPYQDRGGFDGVGQAMSGAMYITGSPGNPAKAAAPYVDYATAVLAAFGTLAALLHKNATGEGQEVKTTLLGTALAVFGSHLIEQSVTGINRAGSGNRVQTSAPSDVFATADGHVLTHTVGDALFQALGAPDGRGTALGVRSALRHRPVARGSQCGDPRAHARLVRHAHHRGGGRAAECRGPAGRAGAQPAAGPG